MDNSSDLNNAERRRDSQTVFKFFQDQISKTDTGLRNVQEVATGPRFRKVSRVGSSFTNLNTQQTLISELIQANALQTSNIIEFEIVGTSVNASGVADNITFRVKYGGSILTLGPISLPFNVQSRMFRIVGWLYGRGTIHTQKLAAIITLTDVAGSFGAGLVNTYNSADLAISSENDQTFEFSIQHATALVTIGSTLLFYKLGAPITAS